MKDKFFQRAFDRGARESSRRTRRLSLESLENREMLNVDWSGFGGENISTYEPSSSSASYSVDLSGSVDVCDLTDVTGDGRNELVAVNYASKTISVYANTATNGDFTLKGSQTLSSLSGTKGYDSVIFNGDSLTVVSASSGVGLTVTEYTWNASTSAYVQQSQKELDVAKFNSSNAQICVFVGVDATVINGDTLVVQATTLSETGTTVKTALYSGYGTSSFGKNYRIASSITEELMGSTTINGTDYLLLKEKTSSYNDLVLASVDSTISKYSYDLSGYGSALTFDWVVDYDGFLVVGAMTNGASGLITIKSATPTESSVDAKTVGQWIDCDSLRFNSSSAAAIGDVGGDSDPEIFAVNGSQYMFYNGDASSAYDYTFTASDLVVSTPEYVSVDIEDIDGDGDTDAILVGKNRLYTGTVSSTGSIENVTSQYTFSEAVKKAVFGDFNGDGLIDVAVQFQANVGSGVQAFQQLADGSFVALASQAFGGTIADIAVGKFSQTSVDEIAVLTVKNTGTSVSSSVNALKLNGSGFTATRSYVGAGLVGAALTAGSIYGSSVDDLVIVNTTQDTITVLKNSGSALSGATITTAYDSSSTAGSNPIAAAVGDFNGDGLADVAVLNSSAGANYANIVYYLRSSDAGLGSKPAGRSLISGTTTVVGLIAEDLNSDGYSDLTYARKTTNNRVYASVLMGNGSTSVFDAAVNTTISVDFSSNFDLQLARVDAADNVSYDLVWAQDKSVGVLLNADDSVASGSIQYVIQSLSSAAGDTHAAALSTERTWIDEWSNFYVDVWASADGAAVTSATAAFAYNGSYFKLAEVKAASGYTVSYTDESGVATVTATGSRAVDSEGWVLVARMKFEPAGVEGVPLPANGRLAAVNPGFSATATAQSLNGASVSSVSVPSVNLYPFIFDVDESGTVNSNDLAYFLQFLGSDVDNIETAKYRVLDYDLNGTINSNDLAYFLQFLGKSAADGLDSIYYSEPAVSSGAVLDSALTAAVLETSDGVAELFEEEAAVEAVAKSAGFYGPTRSEFATTSVAPVSVASVASAATSKELDLELDVDLDVDL